MIKNITVLGAGTMGSGIARFFAQNGYGVTAYDPNPAVLPVSEIRSQVAKSPGTEGYVRYTTHLEESIREADIIIESVPEDLEIKRQLYSDIAPFLKKEAIVASNTSTFSLSALACQQPFAERMLITHFFNPAHIIPLVEIVRSEHTLTGLEDKVAAFLSGCGKKPVVLKRDIPGFIANRLQAAVLREACFLLENNIADAWQIDTVMKEGPGLRWALDGPFGIADFGGLDIWEKVLNNLSPVLDNAQQAPAIIREKVKRKELGVKTGKGFFDYSADSTGKFISNRDAKLVEIQKALG